MSDIKPSHIRYISQEEFDAKLKRNMNACQSTPAPSQPAPDGTCEECGQPNPIWFAPNDIWNKLIPGRVGFICPRCFALKSPGTAWVLQEAEPRVYSTSDAPSQPAGAREWWAAHTPKVGERFAMPEMLEAYARQQTAAKDAALEAAERERDSLREALTDVSDKVQRLKMYQPVGIAQFRRALREAIDAAEAALKSGRD